MEDALQGNESEDTIHQALIQLERVLQQSRSRINQALETKREEYMECLRRRKDEQLQVQEQIRGYEQQIVVMKKAHERSVEDSRNDERINKYYEDIKGQEDVGECDRLQGKFKELQGIIEKLNKQLSEVERENEDRNRILELLQYVSCTYVECKGQEIEVQIEYGRKTRIVFGMEGGKLHVTEMSPVCQDEIIRRFNRDNDFKALLYRVVNQ